MCVINDQFSIVVTRRLSDEVNIVIRNGKKCLKLSEAMFDAICNAQLSVDYIKGLLRETEQCRFNPVCRQPRSVCSVIRA
jgi:hypothetical protein